MAKKTPPRIKKLPVARQRRMDALLEKNSEGKITSAERQELEELVTQAERLMVENARRLVAFAGQDRADDAVPVTVWIAPQRSAGA